MDILLDIHYLRRSAMNHIATISQWGNSQGLRLPAQICRQLGISVGDQLDISVRDGKALIMVPLKSKYSRSNSAVSLEEIFSGYTGTFASQELEWGEDVGAEVIQ